MSISYLIFLSLVAFVFSLLSLFGICVYALLKMTLGLGVQSIFRIVFFFRFRSLHEVHKNGTVKSA
jgi:hypothetical protein